MKKNKLYKVNKWNQPAFMVDRIHHNIFDGFSGSTLVRPDMFEHQGSYQSPTVQLAGSSVSTLGRNAGNEFSRSLLNNKPATIDNAPQAVAPKESGSKSSGFDTSAMMSFGLGSIPTTPIEYNGTTYRRGAWDLLDPTYQLSGAKSSEAGDILSDMGVASTKTGDPWTMMAGSLLKQAGSVVNALWGSELYEDNIKRVEDEITGMNRQANVMSGSENNEDYMRNSQGMNAGWNFTQGDIGEDGLFAHKAEDTYNDLKRKQDIGRTALRTGIVLGARSADRNIDDAARRNFVYAYGGPLGTGLNTGALEMLMQEKYLDSVNKRSDAIMRNNIQAAKPLGTLRAFGGELGTNGTDWKNGLLYIDAGGSHESNPLEGVPMGLDEEGVPNLVEEGETVYNDYVFSDRMKVPKSLYEELGLPATKKRGKKHDLSFAEVSKKIAKESEQRPNDPISQAGLQAGLSRLAEIQEAERMKQQMKEYVGLRGYALGGRKYKGGSKLKKGFTGLNTYKFDPIEQFKYWDKNSGDYDEGYRDFIENKLNEDWISRVMRGQYGDMSRYKDSNQVNPTVEQAWQLGLDQKNSDWHKAMAAAYEDYLAGIDPKTGLAPSAATIAEESLELDPYSEGWEARRGISTEPVGLDTALEGDKDRRQAKEPKTYPTWMRYAPVFGAGAMSLTDALGLTNKPDYSSVESIEAAANQAGYAPNVQYTPIGNYLTYRPLDIWYEQNALNAQSRATDRALMNTSGGNRGTAMAGLLANGYNSQLASGNLYRQALEYNDANREKVADFNRRTDMFNSQMGLEAAMANARYNQQARQYQLSGLAQAAALRDAIDQRVGAARAANLTNFLNGLGDIGRENFVFNQINSDKSRRYRTNKNGTSFYDAEERGFGGSIKKRK